MARLAGRVGIVTGGGASVGRGIALGLAAEGADVAVLDVDGPAARAVAAEIAALGRRSLACEVDVRSYDRVTAAVQRVEAELGPVDLLVNNAGVGHPDQHFTELDRAHWNRVFGVCVYGTMHVTHAALPGMIARRFGRIVQIGSDVGRAGGGRSTLYATAKAALLGFTHGLAREVAEHGITVNILCPGEIETERSRAHDAARAAALGPEEAERRAARLRASVPLGRVGLPSDVAGAVVFLCAEGGFVTGQTLSVNGGALMF